MSLSRLIAAASLAALASACGRLAPLEPAPGESLPVKPLMARHVPTAEELLQPPTDARPERVDELMKRSQPRERDRFDLPPPAGGAVPLPEGGDKETSSEKSGVTPE